MGLLWGWTEDSDSGLGSNAEVVCAERELRLGGSIDKDAIIGTNTMEPDILFGPPGAPNVDAHR